MADYCGESVGFRVDENKKTVQLICKQEGKWIEYGLLRRLPVSPVEFPLAPRTPGPNSAWDLTWLIVSEENPDGASQLQQILVRDYPSAG